MCSDGEAILKSCRPGYSFDPLYHLCLPRGSAVCHESGRPSNADSVSFDVVLVLPSTIFSDPCREGDGDEERGRGEEDGVLVFLLVQDPAGSFVRPGEDPLFLLFSSRLLLPPPGPREPGSQGHGRAHRLPSRFDRGIGGSRERPGEERTSRGMPKKNYTRERIPDQELPFGFSKLPLREFPFSLR